MGMRQSDPVWLISGCSTGFGREIAKAVLQRGWCAIVTARNASQVADLVELAPERAIACELDVREPAQIERAVNTAQERFGGLDVLVNNAGYGYQATVEEGEPTRIRDLFETNVFGLIRLTQLALPLLRARGGGHIFNISSVAGVMGAATLGYYAATKHAVCGLSESLAEELAPLGINVTVVEPGAFRTDFSSRSAFRTPTAIGDYATSLGARISPSSPRPPAPGDPARAARAIVETSLLASPPLHLALGAASTARVETWLKKRGEEVERWRDLGVPTDFPSA